PARNGIMINSLRKMLLPAFLLSLTAIGSSLCFWPVQNAVLANNRIKAQSTSSAILGKGLENKEIVTIASSPGDNSTIFAGTGNFGIYKSTNSGATWTSINNSGSQPFITVLAIVFDPTNPANIFLGTDAGVFKGTSSGGNWVAKTTGMPFGLQIDSLAISPNNPNILLAGTF